MNKLEDKQRLEEISKEWEELEFKVMDFAIRCKLFFNKLRSEKTSMLHGKIID